ncbi:hypothetical protein Y032_0461g1880 [Ancylostoma ceylanicum]|uniref:Uncharacterized protein n=1 Tax=Ancylostoma ceylanicum TaxID=53326 RepID=A0A016WXA4_9BILA|nr:hypothetical protein Y032_0461g1880 [Ancylostoma ceylanicum]
MGPTWRRMIALGQLYRCMRIDQKLMCTTFRNRAFSIRSRSYRRRLVSTPLAQGAQRQKFSTKFSTLHER